MASSTAYGGRILLDGTELREAAPESVYELISVIQQNVFVFNASIVENISMFRQFPQAELEDAIRHALLVWTLFIGIGAVGGAAMMLLDPSGKTMGMDAMLPYFQVLPLARVLFQDFTFSGWALLIVNGLTNLTAAGLLLARKRAGVVLGGVFGVTLMPWICILFYIFPLNFMSTTYFLFGFAQAATGYMAAIKALDSGESLFFSHYDTKAVEWFMSIL